MKQKILEKNTKRDLLESKLINLILLSEIDPMQKEIEIEKISNMTKNEINIAIQSYLILDKKINNG